MGRAVEAASVSLEALGVDRAKWAGLAALYLLELQVRFAATSEIGGPGAVDLSDRIGSMLRLHLEQIG